MACAGCGQRYAEKIKYENVKELAKKYAKEINEMVFLYRSETGFNFGPISEAGSWHVIEYISPLQ